MSTLSSGQPFVSIVVPTYRRPDVLDITLQALLKLDYPADKFEIIIVDDGSGDGTSNVVSRFQSDHAQLVYHAQDNRGVATARNQGARMARGEILIFVDDDIVVQPSLITQHLETLAEFGDCLVNGHWEFAPELAASLRETPFGRFRIQTEEWVKEGISKSVLKANCVEPSGITACNLSVRREHFWHIGGFDEEFPFAGCEDQEFSLRAAAAGYRFIYNADIQFWHNDHRLSLEQFGERQRRGAITAALLAIKHPEQCGQRALIQENQVIQSGDSLRLRIKKLVKGILSSPPSMAILHRVATVMEHRKSHSPILSKLYWIICGLYIFRGIREGFKRFSSRSSGPVGTAME